MGAEDKKEIALYALTPGGRDLVLRLAGEFPQAEIFFPLLKKNENSSTFKVSKQETGLKRQETEGINQEQGDGRQERLKVPPKNKEHRIQFFSCGIQEVVSQNFHLYKSHIFVMAAGIVVRSIAPHLLGKWSDPGVVVLDEKGTYAISLLSGHWGGANDLVREISHKIGAQPVITTATDVCGKVALEVWAKEEGLRIENSSQIKVFNAALVKDIPIFCRSEYQEYLNRLPEGVKVWSRQVEIVFPDNCIDFLVVISPRTDLPQFPAEHLLLLRPHVLYLGLGCNRGTSEEEIYCCVKKVLGERGYSMLSLAQVGTIDLKADEPGLSAFAQKLGLKVKFFKKEELNRVDPPSEPSDYVKTALSVKGVSECAAMLLAGTKDLVINKVKLGNVTIALAQKQEG